MKTVKILIVTIVSVFILFSCKDSVSKKTPTHKKEKVEIQHKDSDKSKKNAQTQTTPNIERNIFKIDCNNNTALNTYQTVHKSCAGSKKFELKSKVEFEKNSLKIKEFITKIEVENGSTNYYIVEEGVNMHKEFTTNSVYLEINVVLITKKTKDLIKTITGKSIAIKTEEKLGKIDLIKKEIKKGNVIEFHVYEKTFNEETKEIKDIKFGDTKCEPSTPIMDINREYHFCTALITCK